MIVTGRAASIDFSPPLSPRGRVGGTRRELAAALLFDVAGPDPSKAPATILMFNRN
jgi:hypothetical protein